MSKKVYVIEDYEPEPVFVLFDTKQHYESALKKIAKFKETLRKLDEKYRDKPDYLLDEKANELRQKLVESIKGIVGIYERTERIGGKYYFGDEYWTDDIKKVNLFDD